MGVWNCHATPGHQTTTIFTSIFYGTHQVDVLLRGRLRQRLCRAQFIIWYGCRVVRPFLLHSASRLEVATFNKALALARKITFYVLAFVAFIDKFHLILFPCGHNMKNFFQVQTVKFQTVKFTHLQIAKFKQPNQTIKPTEMNALLSWWSLGLLVLTTRRSADWGENKTWRGLKLLVTSLYCMLAKCKRVLWRKTGEAKLWAAFKEVRYHRMFCVFQGFF
jgi:hypothetical protein